MCATPKLYWILTTSLVETNFEKRKEQYTRGIQSVLAATEGLDISIILVENNGTRQTFLDDFCDGKRCRILYTDNNMLSTHYGVKELYDVNACIKHFGISDEDYVIKMTGRYFLNVDNCPFVKELINLTETHYETILKYGSYIHPTLTKIEDCILGLICMKAKYIKQIDTSYKLDCLEHRWARVTIPIPDEQVKIMVQLGIYISPGTLDNFFEV